MRIRILGQRGTRPRPRASGLLVHFLDALYLAAHDEREAALNAAASAQALFPAEPVLERLRRELIATPPRQGTNVEPFLNLWAGE